MDYKVRLCHDTGAIITRGKVKNAESHEDAINRFLEKKFEGIDIEQFCPGAKTMNGDTLTWDMGDVDADFAEGYFKVIPIV